MHAINLKLHMLLVLCAQYNTTTTTNTTTNTTTTTPAPFLTQSHFQERQYVQAIKELAVLTFDIK